jgi:hypothetical protein
MKINDNTSMKQQIADALKQTDMILAESTCQFIISKIKGDNVITYSLDDMDLKNPFEVPIDMVSKLVEEDYYLLLNEDDEPIFAGTIEEFNDDLLDMGTDEEVEILDEEEFMMVAEQNNCKLFRQLV